MCSQNLVDVIFLDIDGVLLPFGGTKNNYSKNALTYTNACLFPDCTMDALTTLLQRIQSIQGGNPVLVLSSTWRAQSNFIQDILASFRVYVEEKGVNDASTMLAWGDHLHAFFDVCDPHFHATRHDEIYKWVNDNVAQNTMQHTKRNAKGKYTVRSWIALDDEDLVNVEGRVMEDAKKHAVQTKSSVGLTLEAVDVGVELIKMQMQEFHGDSL